MNSSGLHIGTVMGSFRTGGAERAMINLSNGFLKKGITADVVVVNNAGEFISLVDAGINVYDLKKKHARNSVFKFRKYLKTASPDVLIVVQTHIQFMVFVAVVLSGWKGALILNEQSTFSLNNKNIFLKYLIPFLFRRVNAIIVVSEGSSRNLNEVFPSFTDKIHVISNPVFIDEILILKDENIIHPFFSDKKNPVILSAGRLTKSKNFTLLIDAFALVRKKTDARLIILGEGEERSSIEMQANKHGLLPFVSLPGNMKNPFAYMNRCDVFVLSSDYEGLPSVLIEALTCGCNIVSTDCPHGPAEILENWKYGDLVPLHDAEKLSEAILKNITAKKNIGEKLKRAMDFGVEEITDKYLELIKRLLKSE